MLLKSNRIAQSGELVIQPKADITPVQVKNFAAAIQNNSGVVDISGGVTKEMYSVPESTTYTIANTNNATTKSITAWVFNESVLNNTLTSQSYTSGDEPTITYNDGFSGKLISQLIQNFRMGRGMRCKTITINGYVGGTASDAAITAMNFALQGYNAIDGTPIPANYNLNQALRNTQFKDGMVTVDVDLFINAVSQIKFDVPKNYSYTLVFEWDYSDIKG